MDQKAWIQVKYTPFSQKLFRLGNHSMCTISDGESYEKTIIFGGITHSKLGGQRSYQKSTPWQPQKSKNKLLSSKHRKQFDTLSSKKVEELKVDEEE